MSNDYIGRKQYRYRQGVRLVRCWCPDVEVVEVRRKCWSLKSGEDATRERAGSRLCASHVCATFLPQSQHLPHSVLCSQSREPEVDILNSFEACNHQMLTSLNHPPDLSAPLGNTLCTHTSSNQGLTSITPEHNGRTTKLNGLIVS